MGAPMPRMHGSTHVPGGPDPIPGLELGGARPFADVVLGLATTRDLRGYWRLGDGASPFADISGFGTPGADAVKTTSGTAMTDSITGALPAADDDGAVQFNNTSGAAGDYLDVPQMTPPRFNFGSGTAPMTVTAWVRPSATTNTFTGDAVSSWDETGFGASGWRLGIEWPARTPFFQRREQGSPAGSAYLAGTAVAADTWAFLVGTYDPVTGHSLYVNGALVATNPALFENLQAGGGPNIGRNAKASAPFETFYGGVDEVTVWGDALTPADVAALLEAGAGGIPGPAGPAGPPGPNVVNDSTASPLVGMLKANGTDVDVAVAGTDYATPTQLTAKVDRDAVEIATARLVQVKLASGDTQPAFKIRGDGTLIWGAGGTTLQDSNLYRQGVSILRTDGQFYAATYIAAYQGTANESLLGQGRVTFGTDTSLYRALAGFLKTDTNLAVAKSLYVEQDTGAANQSGLVVTFSGIGSRTVQAGAADSGGAGYRMLRIPN